VGLLDFALRSVGHCCEHPRNRRLLHPPTRISKRPSSASRALTSSHTHGAACPKIRSSPMLSRNEDTRT
jgi:hypothetical protein